MAELAKTRTSVPVYGPYKDLASTRSVLNQLRINGCECLHLRRSCNQRDGTYQYWVEVRDGQAEPR